MMMNDNIIICLYIEIVSGRHETTNIGGFVSKDGNNAVESWKHILKGFILFYSILYDFFPQFGNFWDHIDFAQPSLTF